VADAGADCCRLVTHRGALDAGSEGARLVAGFVAFAALASLWQFIRKTNFQVARFIESVRFEDYSQRFSDPSGGGFDVLGDTLDVALKTLQARHAEASNEAAISPRLSTIRPAPCFRSTRMAASGC
jgi:hypothetical protein